jgi:protein-S-isoprenylcysteine O-methyltransferase Ste14
MNPWYAKAAVIAGLIGIFVIRGPHGQRSRRIKVVKGRRGKLEVLQLTASSIGSFLPLVWIVAPRVLSFADYRLRPAAFIAGCACIAMGLWYLYRSHADLGRNFSVTLEVREGHSLVTEGVYRHIRHPMYLAFFLYSAGQALVVPNWIAGPFYLVEMVLLFGLRVGPEERMMTEEFGREYEAYVGRTKRLIRGVW